MGLFNNKEIEEKVNHIDTKLNEILKYIEGLKNESYVLIKKDNKNTQEFKNIPLNRNPKQTTIIYNNGDEKVYSSILEASNETGYTYYAIYNNRDKSSGISYQKDIEKVTSNNNVATGYKITVYDNGKKIGEYNSIREASRETGISLYKMNKFKKKTGSYQYFFNNEETPKEKVVNFK